MRNRFDEQLFELNRELIEMGAACEDVIGSAIDALLAGDVDLASRVRTNSQVIDQLERDIEGRCMKLLLHQQPVARDLRLISAALKMITDMERIGDQAEDIAEIVMMLDGQVVDAGMAGDEMAGDKLAGNAGLLGAMAKKTAEMVSDSVDAFVHRDVSLAQQVLVMDDTVDEYFVQIKQDIISAIEQQKADGERALDLLMIAKYFERIGDHATNIAEWVIYAVTGAHKEEVHDLVR